MNAAIVLRRVVKTLPRFQYRLADEIALHEGIASVLQQAQIAHQREVVAGPRNRFDFLVEPGIVIEAKIKGSLSQVLGQVDRYAARDNVHGVVLVTTRFWANAAASVGQLHGNRMQYLVPIVERLLNSRAKAGTLSIARSPRTAPAAGIRRCLRGQRRRHAW